MASDGIGELTPILSETLQNDFKSLSLEARKKYPQVKEACEEAINKLKSSSTTTQINVYYLTNQIIYPISQGCETKDVKLVRICLQLMQKLIINQLIDQKGAVYITDALWTLMESGIEEVKILQTVLLLLTTNTIVHGDTLARTLVLCFRLHFAKSSTTINTAGATVRQLVYLVFERVMTENDIVNSSISNKSLEDYAVNTEELKIPSSSPPKGLSPCAGDAYLLFQDLVQLVNADQPYWLIGMTEMTRTFGLTLLESILTQFYSVFYKFPEFSFLLKERVCALVIKLFSPNIKYRNNMPANNAQQATSFDKPYFPISMRLLRVVLILIQKYHSLLITESEIFLSLIVKFLDPDKPSWQRSLALEVLHKMTIQPELLVSFCKYYDLNKHTTNIFQDIVNSLGAYIQSLFVNPNLSTGSLMQGTQMQPPVLLNNFQSCPNGGGGSSPQPGFCLRGVCLNLIVTFPTGQAKSTYLEILDRIEPPVIPDGYGISLAYACLIEIIRSLQIIITPQPHINDESNVSYMENSNELNCQLINSSWCGLLAALSHLVDASNDETITETILKSMQNYTSLCGLLNLHVPRDAFITTICKFSLPPHYALAVLNTITMGSNLKYGSVCGIGGDMQQVYGENDLRHHQIVAVGTPLPIPTSSSSSSVMQQQSQQQQQQQQQGPVMLTSKNLQAMRALLSLAHCHGSILGTAWHFVLTTLQHLVWILGLKPSTGGSLKAVRASADSNAIITTSVMADLPILSSMLSRLFESSEFLDDVALHHLINALCKLSQEAMEVAYSNREPSLFAVAKLLETGLVNLYRIEVIWRPLTNHLLEVCHHPHIRMREWGVEAITYLVKTALHYKYETPLKDNQKLQTLLLGPLYELSSVPHGDVRQRQLECILQILHSNGETLSYGWPITLGIIGAVNDQHGENLIRIAFQCLQLVITDFLPIMPWKCLPQCVDTVAKFGSQTQELNISLTSVGLMWNISDYFHQNRGKIIQTLGDNVSGVLPDFPGTPDMPGFDKLWMCLYARLGELCVDSRPALRKSASQTLFSTISAHGGLLKSYTWHIMIWQVLFPLLDKVMELSNSASNEKVDSGGNILIHHSRNTAQKQWAETEAITLSGVARVFNSKKQLLQSLGDFPRAWSILLQFIENAALNRNNEVSIAALKSFQEIVFSTQKNQESKNDDGEIDEGSGNWRIAWKVWLKIGTNVTLPVTETDNKNMINSFMPSQMFLIALLQIFPSVFQHIKKHFTLEDFQEFKVVMTHAICVPLCGEISPYAITLSNDINLTTLQDSVLHAIELIEKNALASNDRKMIPEIFRLLLEFSKLTCTLPNCSTIEYKFTKVPDLVATHYIPFGEKATKLVVNLYDKSAHYNEVIEENILKEIISTLHIPLALKYNCVSSSIWKQAANSLIIILRVGLEVARTDGKHFVDMWNKLAETLNDFLFPNNCYESRPGEKGLDEMISDEQIDCNIIELLRTDVLPYSTKIPKDFIMEVVILLNKGSIHSATNVKNDRDVELREDFAKICFETLLQFSLTGGDYNNFVFNSNCDERTNDITGQLAVTSLLHRFKEVLIKYIDDEKLSGKCPLPRYRLSEISFVLKALSTLILSLKKSAAVKDDNKAWEQLISLYPYLVECTTTTSTQVSRPLREALLQYCDLLQPLQRNVS